MGDMIKNVAPAVRSFSVLEASFSSSLPLSWSSYHLFSILYTLNMHASRNLTYDPIILNIGQHWFQAEDPHTYKCFPGNAPH